MTLNIRKIFKYSFISILVFIILFYLCTLGFTYLFINGYLVKKTPTLIQSISDIETDQTSSENIKSALSENIQNKVIAKENAPQPEITNKHENEKKEKEKIQQYRRVLTFIQKAKEDLDDGSHPHLCEIICSTSTLPRISKNSSIFDNNQFEIFEEWYESEGNRAFDDFRFRLFLEKSSSITSIFDESFFGLYEELINVNTKNSVEIATLSMKAQYYFVKFIARCAMVKKQASSHSNYIKKIEDISKKCKSTDQTDLKSICYSVSF